MPEPPRIGGDAAIVEGQRRGAAGDRDRLVQVEREGDGLAGVEVAGWRATRSSDAMVGVVVSICGPLWVRPESERLAALPAPSLIVAELRLTAVAARLGGVLPGTDGVAEGQRIGAGAAGIGGGAAVVEGERRGAAGDRHRLVQVERQRDRLAGIEIAAGRRLGQATRWSAWWCRSAGRSGSGRRARDWRHCRRRLDGGAS